MMPRRIREWVRSPRVTPAMTKGFMVAIAVVAVGMPLMIIATPYIEFFNDMAVQQKVKPQMVLQVREGVPAVSDLPSPAGTLARGEAAWPFGIKRTPPPPDETREARAAREARQEQAAGRVAEALSAGVDVPAPFLPPAPTMASMRRGQKRYNEVCIVCHGQYGMGDGRVPTRGFPAPANLLSDRVRAFPDGRVFHVVTNGQAAMPGYSLQLSVADRWAVVHYVRALQRAFPPASPAPAAAGATP